VLFRHAAALIDARQLSVGMDVTYTRELADIPDSYVADRLAQALESPVVTLGSYPWRDEFGFGEVRRANLKAVRQDIAKNGPLYFATKLARLLSGQAVRENGYNMAAAVDPDERDPRVIEGIRYGSVVTWQCIAPAAIDRKARYLSPSSPKPTSKSLSTASGWLTSRWTRSCTVSHLICSAIATLKRYGPSNQNLGC